jgi:muramoyltetrapeptide carboxypeptidase
MMDMKGSPSGFRKPAYRVIHEIVARSGYPVMFGFPAGHGQPNLSLPMGREVTVVVEGDGCCLKW